MCGRFTLASPPEVLAQMFELDEVPAFRPRYNIAPTQPVAAVRLSPQGREREFTFLTWGLIPSWAKDIRMGARMINARAETVAEKPAYRAAFRYRRCLIPADGFYEWQKRAGGKQPYFIGMKDGRPFAMAGLWEHWEGDDGSVIESCTILTTTPNELVAPLHNRMPVILPGEVFDAWLRPNTPASDLKRLLRPYPAEAMRAYAVSTLVNSPANDTPACIAPLS
ncbi:MAG: SOS response-associated peptidase [Caldilineae bacterium]|nr:MAG: SOS response-associated peptidase [Caldilineae bacterium]